MLPITKVTTIGGLEVWQDIDEMAQGGFTLDTSNLATQLALEAGQVIAQQGGAVLLAGSMVSYNETTRLAQVVKSASLYSAALNTDTTLNILKGHPFVAGDFVGYTPGGVAVTISSINTTNPAYDVFTLSATLGSAIPAFGAVFASSAAGATSAAYVQQPNGLTYQNYPILAGQDIAVVVAGRVYVRRTPGVPVSAQAYMPRITFSLSK